MSPELLFALTAVVSMVMVGLARKGQSGMPRQGGWKVVYVPSTKGGQDNSRSPPADGGPMRRLGVAGVLHGDTQPTSRGRRLADEADKMLGQLEVAGRRGAAELEAI